jgi:hypothetical protein|tara:strand:- start:11135 stop:13558 length:2424 start_codon:yes stop_codon:yes gene_type:complete
MSHYVKSGLSALSSCPAKLCPKDVSLDQFVRTYNGDFKLNFIQALSGAQSFQNLNFTNFYLSDRVLLDTITTTKKTTIEPTEFSSTLNFAQSGSNYLGFRPALSASFKENNNMYNLRFYGGSTFSSKLSDASNFEITIVDDFKCRVAIIVDNTRYYLVVSDNNDTFNNNGEPQRPALFVSQNKLFLSAFNLEYNFSKYLTNSYINLFTTKTVDGTDYKYSIVSNGNQLAATRLASTQKLDFSYAVPRSIKLDQDVTLAIPSPYNTSYITYDGDGNIDKDNSDFNLPSNYLLYSASNKPCQDFNLINLKNIVNSQDAFTSSNNLLSTSSTTIFCEDLRNYTSIFCDIDSERNEVLALNYVYNNYDILIKPGTTYFNTPSSMEPFTKLNINDTKFADCGSFSFTRPDLADRVYMLDDDSIKDENVTYLCTWLSGAIGRRGIWVDRYYYPDLVSKETALAGSNSPLPTYDQAVENLIMTNSGLKTSVTNEYFMDKKSDLTFEPQKRYKYERVKKLDFVSKSPTNFCEAASIGKKVTNYFNTINTNGGFGLGFTIQNNAGNFTLGSRSNMIDGGFDFNIIGNTVSFVFKLFDNSTTGSITNEDGEIIKDVPISERLAKNTFEFDFKIDLFDKNNIFLSFNALQGECRLYLNSVELYSFEINAYQMFTKKILFGDIFVQTLRFAENRDNPVEILLNEATNQKYISNLYLATEPLNQDDELGVIFSTNMEDIQDLYISLPCGMRNMTDTLETVNSINTNLKNKSNIVDINVKNLNIDDNNITEEVRNMLINNIRQSIPETTNINNINFINYKK